MDLRSSSRFSVSMVLVVFSYLIPLSSSGDLGSSKLRISMKKVMRSCNVYQGSWVFDDSYPLYDSEACPFIHKRFDCQKYGRPDNLYVKYRWKPKDQEEELSNRMSFYILKTWDYVQDGEITLKHIDRMDAFRKGLTTWANWVDSTEWNETGVTNCGSDTKPIIGSIYPCGLPRAMYVLKDVLNQLERPIHLLDRTTLSQLRKDI
ncbi:Trichome birefringence-like family [Trema orientale]|uniref:Trichome birefringence-like family n=1 Tax=Trema orientale TaxID=63057 RepID=A0A2P5BQX0_TREOI|nr:Trichome birefringence-like family [Trema orientale]